MPRYLEEWWSRELPSSYSPTRIHLPNLKVDEVKELALGRFEQESLELPDGLANAVYSASDQGNALFARLIVDDAIAAISNGEVIDLVSAPHSLSKYVQSQLNDIVDHTDWNLYHEFFWLLTFVKEAVGLEFANSLVKGKIPSFRLLPDKILRWMVVNEAYGDEPSTIFFAHPRLASAFASAERSQSNTIFVEFASRLESDLMSSGREVSPSNIRYALRYLPTHFLDEKQQEKAQDLLMDLEFVTKRQSQLSAKEFADRMIQDWRLDSNLERGDE